MCILWASIQHCCLSYSVSTVQSIQELTDRSKEMKEKCLGENIYHTQIDYFTKIQTIKINTNK